MQGGYTDDIYDEIASLKRGYAYDQNYKNYSSYSSINWASTYDLYGKSVSPIELNINSSYKIIDAFSTALPGNMALIREEAPKRFNAYYAYYLRSGMNAFEAFSEAAKMSYDAPIRSFFNGL